MNEVLRINQLANQAKKYESLTVTLAVDDVLSAMEQLTATNNSLTNAQEALKSAGIEADTVQAGVMELVTRMNQMAAENVALKDLQPTEAMISAAHQELENYDNIHLDDDAVVFTWQAMRGLQKTPATDAYMNAVRAGFLPAGLHPSTSELVLTFAKALAEKLHRSEQKYGWSDGWKNVGWQDKCLADFHHHISKGDPRDVAAYCAFMWYHGWPTQSAPTINLNAVRADAVVEAFVTVFDVCSRDDHIDEKLWNYGVLRVEKHADEYVAQLRAGNAGKDGV